MTKSNKNTQPKVLETVEPETTETTTNKKDGISPIAAAGHNLDQIQEKYNVSQAIRFLASEGFARADIARFLNKRYQHVRNVLEQDKIKKAQEAQKSTETK